MKRLSFTKYLITVAIVTITTMVQLAVWRFVDPAPFLLYYAAVILASLHGSGGLAIILSALAVQYFFVPPMDSLRVSDSSDVVRLVIFLISALMIRHLTRALSDALVKTQQERDRAQATESRLTTTLSSIGDCVISTDSDNRIVFMNSVAEKLTGWFLAEALGKTLNEVFHIEKQTVVGAGDDPMGKMLHQSGNALAHRIVLTSRFGAAVTIEERATPIRTLDGQSIFGQVIVFRDVSSRHQQEERLAEAFHTIQFSEQRIRSVVDNALDAVVGMDVNGRITEWNPQAEKTFGFTAAEALGQKMSHTIIPPQYREAHEQGMKRYMSTGEGKVLNKRIEITALRRNGTEFPIELSITPIRSAHSLFFAAFIRDISEQKRLSSDLLLKSEALENSLNGFDIVDAQGKFLYANRAYLKMWGYDRLDEVVGSSPVSHCEDPTIPRTIISELRTKGECDIIFVARRRDGSTFDVRMLARIAQDAEGREVYVATSLDVTEQRRIEESLRYQRDVTQAIADNAASCLFMMDRKGHPTFMNAAAKSVTGYQSLDEIKDRPLHYAIHWKKPDGTLYPIEECPIDRRHPYSELLQNHEEMFCRKDGSLFPVSCSLAPLEKNGEVVGCVLEFRDISEQKRIESALTQAIAARDDFISICSHELKTPLTSMKLQFQTGARQLKKGDPQVYSQERVQRRIETANRQLDRMSALIEDMLDVSRIGSGKLTLNMENLDVVELTRDVWDRFSEQFSSLHIDVDMSTSIEHATCYGDRFRLEQVISNLLTNALKYGGGKPVHLHVDQNEGFVRLTLRDEGIGIPAASLDRIFDRFERAISASSISGLGLGLFISREIIEAHQGRIWVESEEGKGSTFGVELPWCPEEDSNLHGVAPTRT